tara:strand:- start:130 stop:327 length:198 start_codon:yes stop_codon:yes gene_type:complete
MKKVLLLLAPLVLLSSCSFNESENPPIAGASAIVGSRNVIGAEVNILGWRRVGIGLWFKEPTEAK